MKNVDGPLPSSRRGALAVLGLAGCLLATGTARAQLSPSMVLDSYAAGETVEDDFHLSRATDFGHLRFGAQLTVDYALNPLVLEARAGEVDSERFSVVEHQLTGTVGLSFGLWDRLTVFAGLPVTLVMDGVDPARLTGSNYAPANGPGLSDLYLGARGRIIGESDDIGALAAQLTLTLPTGAYEPAPYRTEDFVTLLAELIGELRPGLGSRFVLNVGVRIRDEDAPAPGNNFEARHALTFGLGFAMPVWTDANPGTHLDVHAQIYGSTAFNYFFERVHTPLEGTVGAKIFHESGLMAGLAGGTGINRGFGSPDLRLIGTIGWAMPVEAAAPVDTDGDGLLDPDDRCPTEPEDRDGFEDEDGCPDLDNDGDGIPDADDSCPLQPETQNGVEDEDGCPDAVGDRDGDGLPDDADECPDEPEDLDGFEDENGCPDPDNDADGVADTSDRCPLEAGPAANEGCPDSDRDGDTVPDRIDNCPDEPGPVENHGCEREQQVVIEQNRLQILDHVYFQTNSATIERRSYALLDNVATVLASHPEIAQIVVEGHTDARGSVSHNTRLSQRRAEAVVAYLVREGLEAGRLSARGYGPSRPVVPEASTPEEHAQNRRVEFTIPPTSGIVQREGSAPAETVDR